MEEIETGSSDPNTPEDQAANPTAEEENSYYRIRFRKDGQEFTVQSRIANLKPGDTVIAKTDHGPEPGTVVCRAASASEPDMPRKVSYVVTRRATREEEEKYERLPVLEQEAYDTCTREIKKLDLPMNLIRVERFFNGSKIIFYFTADSRVDFRELVKNLVQEFRTRVEMRQIGVRHETQIIGGIGACGRELCCSSFLKKFESVSIKMAKTQDLPLNPTKISGLCNRLLCCLTYEYDSYRSIKKQMPKVGKTIKYEGKVYRVARIMALQGTILVVSKDGEELILREEQWKKAEPVHKGPAKDQKTE
ncbi:MAG TPA: hypothetical protein ENO11_02085 [Desulfobacteraceae bacterium]|nr:hypothetical protein [Desulfobacteraceae bacterium]